MVNTLSYPNKEYQELIQELERNILLIQGLKGKNRFKSTNS